MPDTVKLTAISSRAWEHPADRAALNSLRALPGFDEAVRKVMGVLGETGVRQLFLGIGAQMVTTLLAVDVVRRGDEVYPSPFAYDLTVIVIIALCLAAILVAFALPRTNQPQDAP